MPGDHLLPDPVHGSSAALEIPGGLVMLTSSSSSFTGPANNRPLVAAIEALPIPVVHRLHTAAKDSFAARGLLEQFLRGEAVIDVHARFMAALRADKSRAAHAASIR